MQQSSQLTSQEEKEYRQLIFQLQSDDLDLLNETVEKLSKNPTLSLPFLLEALKVSNEEIRKNAAWLLGSLRKENAIEALLATMNFDSSIEVRLSAAWSLRNFSLHRLDRYVFKEGTPPQSREHIQEGLRHDSWYVRWYCTVLLSKAQDATFLDSLFDLARNDDNVIVRCSCILTLMLYPQPEVLTLFTELLSDFNDHVKIEAATALSLRGHKAAIPAMIKQLQAFNENVRISMLVALGTLGDLKILPALVQALKDKSAMVKINATMAVMDIVKREPHANPQLSQVLLKLLEDKNAFVVRNAARVLAYIGDEEAYRSIVAKLKTEKDPKIMGQLIMALSYFFDDRSLNILAKLFKHPDWEVRFEVIKALGQLDYSNKIYKLLLQGLKDKSLYVREQAVYALGLTGNEKAIPHLEKLKRQHPYGKINKAIGVALDRLLDI